MAEGRTATRTRSLAGRSRQALQLLALMRTGRVRMAFPPGHYYSPIPDLADVARRRAQLFGRPDDLVGIELREREQLELVEQLAPLVEAIPFPVDQGTEYRYHFKNLFFSFGDAVALYAMVRDRAPARVIEVGSGYSSALVLDVCERWLPDTELTFIEPYPDRLRSLLRPGDADRATIIESPVQSVDPSVFESLSAGDLLFIDSTHVGKLGSDVLALFFQVLPRLRPGVLVHIHDIFYPFEYPESWVFEGRAWNEAYLLRALLIESPRFRVLLWNSFLEARHRSDVERLWPLWGRNPGGSIWLERV